MNISYLAGFFDGEGCISVSQTPRTSRIRVAVTNTKKEVVEEYYNRFGGSIFLANRDDSPQARPQWVWSLAKKSEIQRFLDEVGKHLVLKSEQVKLADEYLCLLQDQGRRYLEPKEVTFTRILICEKMKSLNKRGR